MAGDRVDGWMNSWGMAGSLLEQREYSWKRLHPCLKGSAVLSPEALRAGVGGRGKPWEKRQQALPVELHPVPPRTQGDG